MEITPPNQAKWSAAPRLQAIFLFLWIAAAAGAAEPADTLRSLGQVEVEASRRSRPRLSDDGSLTLNASMTSVAPRLFGEADLARLMLATAGVTAVSDYSSGAAVDGMDYSQNVYLLNGIPVEFPYHFGGIFSTFNASHYPRLTLWRGYHPGGLADCLGGIVATESADTPPRRLSGSVNAGMTASSATLRVPVGRVSVEASARVSYIDALYRPLLATSSTGVSYGFHDLDLTVTWRPDSLNSLRAFAHHNADRMRYDDTNFAMDTRLRWTNSVAGIAWQGAATEAAAGFSRLANRLGLAMPDMALRVPSGVSRWSAKASHSFAVGAVDCRVGAGAYGIDAQPQSVDITGFGTGTGSGPRPHSRATVTKLWAEAGVALTPRLGLTVGVDANALFGDAGFRRTDIDPRLRLTWRHRASSLSLMLGRYHQYVHTVGFSEIGMASNFKIPATAACPPQQSLTAALEYSRMFEPLALKVNVGVHYRRVLGQPEYFGGVIDLLQPGYVAEAFVETCSGHNAGANLTLTRDFSRLTATATYAYVLARRRLPGSSEWFDASSDITHSVNLNAAYRFAGNHWTVSAAWAYASGRPVTPVRAAYFIAERLMVEYGRRNSARLPAYHRLDLGATYRFRAVLTTHAVSLSVINAYGHRNIEISTYAFNISTGQLRQRQVASLYRFLPSLSYTVDF